MELLPLWRWCLKDEFLVAFLNALWWRTDAPMMLTQQEEVVGLGKWWVYLRGLYTRRSPKNHTRSELWNAQDVTMKSNGEIRRRFEIAWKVLLSAQIVGILLSNIQYHWTRRLFDQIEDVPKAIDSYETVWFSKNGFRPKFLRIFQ